MTDFRREDWRLGEGGDILNPGKYQGEPIYAPYYHGVALGGLEEDYVYGDGGSETFVLLGDCDFKMFPEIPDGSTHISVIEREDGFVLTEYLTQVEYNAAVKWHEEQGIFDAA